MIATRETRQARWLAAASVTYAINVASQRRRLLHWGSAHSAHWTARLQEQSPHASENPSKMSSQEELALATSTYVPITQSHQTHASTHQLHSNTNNFTTVVARTLKKGPNFADTFISRACSKICGATFFFCHHFCCPPTATPPRYLCSLNPVPHPHLLLSLPPCCITTLACHRVRV